MVEPLLSDREVAPIIGRARSTLQKDRVAGTGIPFVRIGRLVRYRAADIAAFVAALPVTRSTSEVPARPSAEDEPKAVPGRRPRLTEDVA